MFNVHTAVFEQSVGVPSQLMKSNLPEIVFAGKSNVGKSSMINKLVNRKSLARTSNTPGKTATINFYKLDNLRLVDLPGYGFAKISNREKERWADLVEFYFNSNRNISLIIQLIDMRHNPSSDDIAMLEYLCSAGYEFIVALTKSDKLKKQAYNKNLEEHIRILSKFNVSHIIPFSALTGEGGNEIIKIIEKSLKPE